MTSDQELKNRIASALYNADPEGLAVMGAPGDEYASEAEIIMDRLAEINSASDMATLIANVFRRQFGWGTSVNTSRSPSEPSSKEWTEAQPLYSEADLNQIYNPESEVYRILGQEIWNLIND